MILDINYWTRIAKRIFIFFISLIIVGLSLKLAIFYMPFLIGFIISLLVEPIIKFVNRNCTLTRKTSAVIVLLVLFSIIIGILGIGVVIIISESSRFTAKS